MGSTFSKTIGAITVLAALGLATAPVGAQQQAAPGTSRAPEQGAASGGSVPDATVQRTGAALRDISGIQARFNQRIQGSQPAEHAAIEQEANSAAQAALAAQGLTIEEYSGVIRLAQADQGLRERLITAARGAQ